MTMTFGDISPSRYWLIIVDPYGDKTSICVEFFLLLGE